MPVLKASAFGDWPARWQSMLDRYPTIPDLVLRDRRALSFELFGSLNSHLIAYDVGLDIRLLFGVDGAGRVTPPSRLGLDLPAATLLGRAESGADLAAIYLDWRARFTAHTSFNDPRTPPGAPPRQSIEARALVFF